MIRKCVAADIEGIEKRLVKEKLHECASVPRVRRKMGGEWGRAVWENRKKGE